MHAQRTTTPIPLAETGAPPRDPNSLDHIRHRIDGIDDAIVDLICTRLDLARQAATSKRLQGMPSRDLLREAEVVRRAAMRARERGVAPEPVRDVFWSLIGLSHL